jgi:hypothetical protein
LNQDILSTRVKEKIKKSDSNRLFLLIKNRLERHYCSEIL